MVSLRPSHFVATSQEHGGPARRGHRPHRALRRDRGAGRHPLVATPTGYSASITPGRPMVDKIPGLELETPRRCRHMVQYADTPRTIGLHPAHRGAGICT